MKTEIESCPKLVVTERIGICKLMNCICPCFDCDFKDKCPEYIQCHEQDWKEVNDALFLYRKASRKLKDTIRNKMKQIPEKELYGGLFWQRENSLLAAFTESQGDLISACIVNNYLKNAPILSADDIRATYRTEELCHLISFKYVLDSDAHKLSNQDIVLFATDKGIDSLYHMADRPFDSMKEKIQTITEIRQGEFKESETLLENRKKAWTLKMVEPYKWCKKNKVPICLDRIKNGREFRAIQKHMETLGQELEENKGSKRLCLDKKVCFELSYPLYESLIFIFRNIYTNFPSIGNTMTLLEEKKINPWLTFPSLEIEDWDKLVMDAFFRQDSENFTFESNTIKNAEWPISVEDGSFWASILMMSFIQKNMDEIATKFSERGWIFENKVRTELIDRGIKILKKNLETPFGDVDLICESKGKLLAVEAKDYKPWYDDWGYISNRVFEKRRIVLKGKLSQIPQRENWINTNREALKLSKNIESIVINRYKESNMDIESFTLDMLDSIFGPSKFPKYSETLPEYAVSDGILRIQVMGRNIHFPPTFTHASIKTSSGLDVILRPCSKYPECLCIHLDDNPWLLKMKGELPKLCNMLQITIEGGPCPYFHAFCMWAGFCKKSIDPTSFVKELTKLDNRGN